MKELLKHWPGQWRDASDPKAVHEAKLLNLAIDKAHHLLDWSPAWDFQQAVAATMLWYRGFIDGSRSVASMSAFTSEQIRQYEKAAAAKGIAWAVPPV